MKQNMKNNLKNYTAFYFHTLQRFHNYILVCRGVGLFSSEISSWLQLKRITLALKVRRVFETRVVSFDQQALRDKKMFNYTR